MFLSRTRWAIFSISLCLILGACRSNEAIYESHKPQDNISAPTNTVKLDLWGSIDTNIPTETLPNPNELRSFDGLKVVNNKLLPQISENAKVIAILGSTKRPDIYMEELTWSYNSTEESLISATLQGDKKTPLNYSAPLALLKAGGLRMMLMLLPEGSYDATNKVINLTTNELGKRLAPENNGQTSLQIPYFSNWASVQIKGKSLSLASGESFRLSPQGKILKIQVTNEQTTYSDLAFRGIAIQTNTMSMFGKYNLSQIRVNNLPTWESADHTTNSILGNYPYKRAIPRRDATNINTSTSVTQANYVTDLAKDATLKLGQTSTYYTWFMPEVKPFSMSQSNGAKVEQEAMTRLYIRTARAKDANNRTNIDTYSFIPVYLSKKKSYSQKGAQVSVKITNPMVVSPIETFADTRLVTHLFRFFGQTETSAYENDNWSDKWSLLMSFPPADGTSQRATIRFSSAELSNKGFYGNQGKTKDGKTWYMPYISEMRALVPIDLPELNQVFGATRPYGSEVATIDEKSVRLHGVGTTGEETYQGSYYRMPNINRGADSHWLGGVEIAALRFMKSGDETLKTAVFYELAPLHNRPTTGNKNQYHYRVKTYYLGAQFPEIKTAKDLYRYRAEIIDQSEYWRRERSRYVIGVSPFTDMIRLYLNTNDLVNGRYAVVANDNEAPKSVKISYRDVLNKDYGVYMLKR